MTTPKVGEVWYRNQEYRNIWEDTVNLPVIITRVTKEEVFYRYCGLISDRHEHGGWSLNSFKKVFTQTRGDDRG